MLSADGTIWWSKIFDLWSTQKYSKVSKICLACSSIIFRVSYVFKPTVSYLDCSFENYVVNCKPWVIWMNIAKSTCCGWSAVDSGQLWQRQRLSIMMYLLLLKLLIKFVMWKSSILLKMTMMNVVGMMLLLFMYFWCWVVKTNQIELVSILLLLSTLIQNLNLPW